MFTDHETFEFVEDEGDDVDVDLEEAENHAEAKLKKLREKYKRCDEEKRQLMEDLQRVKADFLNSKKRLEEEHRRLKDTIIDSHITGLLPLCDSFAMAMSNKEAWEAVDSTWRVGVEGIHGQLMNILESNGVSPIDPTGEPFDPERHEAASNESVTDEAQNNVVQKVIQHGYERTTVAGTRLIRPARVAVGTYESNT